MSAHLIDVEGGSSRELSVDSKEERTAWLTHFFCQGSRLLFLVAHGILVLVVASVLDRLDQVSWWAAFLPVWIGDSLCGALLVAAWFVSCPYIKLCLAERQPRLGENPSILTEILPEIVLSALSLLFLLLTFLAEYFFCAYLDSAQKGNPKALPAATVLFSIVGLLSLCYGILFKAHSALFVAAGGSVLTCVLTFVATRDGSHAAQALSLAPVATAVLGLLIVSAIRTHRHLHVLTRVERITRVTEAVVLAVLLLAVIAVAVKVGCGKLVEASTAGSAVGAALCLLGALQARLCCAEARLGPPDDRRFGEEARAHARRLPSEVLISMADSVRSG